MKVNILQETTLTFRGITTNNKILFTLGKQHRYDGEKEFNFH